MNDYEKLLSEGIKQTCGITDEKTKAQLFAYMEAVLETNKSMNLTAITAPDEFIIKHFIDSLSICESSAFKNSNSIVDVGTGAGFPGLPLAIVYPEKNFVLMDSLNKRIQFLEKTVDSLGIRNVKCVHSRAEEMGHSAQYRETFDLCVSRAVARLSVLSEYCLPLVKPGGYFVPYKTSNEDISAGENAVKVLGGKIEEIKDFPEMSGDLQFIKLDHRLIFIKKIKNTPKQYPRKAGTPGKSPL